MPAVKFGGTLEKRREVAVRGANAARGVTNQCINRIAATVTRYLNVKSRQYSTVNE